MQIETHASGTALEMPASTDFSSLRILDQPGAVGNFGVLPGGPARPRRNSLDVALDG
jgi:hypothetical protein